MMVVTLGRDTVAEENSMPSTRLPGRGKFLRYAALVAWFHCVVFFSIEALTWTNYHLVLIKSAVGGVFTMLAIWACSSLFTVKTPKRL
jgi:hypothetical protein